MCGISGYISYGKPISGIDFYQAHCKMAQRGPDDEGFVVSTNNQFLKAYGNGSIEEMKHESTDIRTIEQAMVIIGHVRLSVIDLTVGGHQPVIDESAGLIMSYNGEIYNYQELREELKGRGYKFQSDCDTEVLFRAYQEWGKECFQRLNGMWAVSIYDSKKRELILSRDRCGVKPLFYRSTGESISFASEMKVVCSLQSENEINMASVDKYLKYCRLCDGEDTFVNGIYEVPPGHCLIFSGGKPITDYNYWQYIPERKEISDKEAIDRFAFLFRDSIKLRMRSDVEVGSLLSGGLDSNVIVGTLWGENRISPMYKTFSSVYTDERYSEEKYIQKTVNRLNVKSNLVYMTADKVMGCIDDALMNSEIPTRAVPMMLQYLLYQKIRQTSNIKVVLNGQGADELFGGYTADYMTRFLQLYYEGRIGELFAEIKAFKKNRKASMMQVLVGTLGQARIEHRSKENAFNDIAFHQITQTPLREYLLYDDRAAMAFGIENRAPFLDYRLVEFAFSLHSDMKINRLENKAIVRQYAKGIVVDDILQRKDKMGFTSPQESWQKEEWEDIFDETFDAIRKEGLVGLDGNKYHGLYERYKKNEINDWALIWRIFCLYRWQHIVKQWGVKA